MQVDQVDLSSSDAVYGARRCIVCILEELDVSYEYMVMVTKTEELDTKNEK